MLHSQCLERTPEALSVNKNNKSRYPRTKMPPRRPASTSGRRLEAAFRGSPKRSDRRGQLVDPGG
eukprot:11063943-Alexandrium_andersonii.AAC.1